MCHGFSQDAWVPEPGLGVREGPFVATQCLWTAFV